MYIQIEPSNGIPIYEQVVRQVKFAVADGTLVPGQLVPSTRDLARQLAVNPNTIQRAYQQLQSEQVLESLRGRGQAVCSGAVDRCIDQRSEIIKSRLGQVVAEALGAGLAEAHLRQVFEQAIKAAATSGTSTAGPGTSGDSSPSPDASTSTASSSTASTESSSAVTSSTSSLSSDASVDISFQEQPR